MILCAGEALIDMLPRKTEGGAAGFAPYPGGAVFNTAVALSRLGQKTAMFTGISDDLFGEQLARVFDANGVSRQYVQVSDRPTTLAFVTLTDGHAKYAFYDENTAGRMLTPDDLPGDLGDIAACFFGGISLAVEPCAEAYEALCLREAPARAIMLDPNIRPGFIRDEARYRARLDKMLAAADIVKLSDEDLHWLMGDGDLGDLARDLVAKGPRIVCITRGAEGVTGCMADREVTVPAERVEVVDTVGAGDTFNAGFLASLAEQGLLSKSGLDGVDDGALEEALSLGARAAAITVSRAGANPPRRDEL
ncbi:carbohydrate kinase [Rhodobacterales bacterium HKCCE3408]|nr:carbohydrate kinase [Rhodobacterales bacterium HKCCE3408]